MFSISSVTIALWKEDINDDWTLKYNKYTQI